MENDVTWKKFESSGQIQDYIQFRQSVPMQTEPSKESADADNDNGAGTACNQNG